MKTIVKFEKVFNKNTAKTKSHYKIDENDLAYKLFTEHGFKWGGSWQELKDYQHFEIPTPVIEKLYKQN
ncbi:MAG: M15 family metallopeptidase [Treponema sp.]